MYIGSITDGELARKSGPTLWGAGGGRDKWGKHLGSRNYTSEEWQNYILAGNNWKYISRRVQCLKK